MEALLRPVPLLTPAEEAALRTSNAAQLARARALGVHVPDSASLARLIQAGTLVQLPDSTRWWVVRELDHSLPYVVPDVVVLLERIGTRFQDALAAMGLPPYRIEVTSVLRTPEGQAALREGNVNAAQGTSTHEYGTTLDIAYESFAAPAVDGPARWRSSGSRRESRASSRTCWVGCCGSCSRMASCWSRSSGNSRSIT